MAYTTVNKHTDYFNTVLWTGNGSTMTITDVGFNADLVWTKLRSGADDHRLFDKVRGINKYVKSNETAAETTDAILSTTSDGYSLASAGEVTANGGTFVGWNWLANGSGSSNTDGTITSTVSANTTAGFSIVQWTGTGSAGTIAHGLGAVPGMIFVKKTSQTDSWFVWHTHLGTQGKLNLDNNSAIQNNVGYWNNTLPTNQVFSVTSNGANNASGETYIAYCFANVPGYCRIGTYVGNGDADGAYVYTGFKPSFILTKTTGTDGWRILDNKRLGYNPNNSLSQPNVTQADSEQTWHDIVSNGFKLRTTDTGDNASGTTYIYMAIGQSLVGTNNIPCVAR